VETRKFSGEFGVRVVCGRLVHTLHAVPLLQMNVALSWQDRRDCLRSKTLPFRNIRLPAQISKHASGYDVYDPIRAPFKMIYMRPYLKLARVLSSFLSLVLLLQPSMAFAQGAAASNSGSNEKSSQRQTSETAASSQQATANATAAAVSTPPAADPTTAPKDQPAQTQSSQSIKPETGAEDKKKSKDKKSKKAGADAQSTNKCFMWKITGKKGRSAYLLGSMHLVTPNVYPLKPEIEQAFKDSSSMVCEANIKAMSPQKLGALALAKGVYLGDDNIEAHISKDTKAALDKFFAGKGGIEKMQKMRPWLLATLIIVLGVKKLGYDEKLGIDNHFLDASATAGKKIYELEGAEFQLNLISGLSDDLQDKFLMSSLLDIKELESSMTQMSDAWKSGDAGALDELLSKTFTEHPELADVQRLLITDRNIAMTEGIEKLLEEKEHPFVVVGAAHLVGDKGIVALIKKKHYKAVQITSSQGETNSANPTQSTWYPLPPEPTPVQAAPSSVRAAPQSTPAK